MKSEYINCKNCKDDCRCRGKNITPICVSFTPVKTTNADRIRGMTDEELAKWVNFHTDCENCPNRECADPYSNPNFCVNSLLSWLKAPVEEVDK